MVIARTGEELLLHGSTRSSMNYRSVVVFGLA
jgi:nitroimidazol reductase NimA-like FMN-containing flavoprotein (pyridoxamine 5'-phosphate oxidase superfamily)